MCVGVRLLELHRTDRGLGGMLHGAVAQDADRDGGGGDGGYDLAALFLMDPPQPGAAPACLSSEGWPGDVAVGSGGSGGGDRGGVGGARDAGDGVGGGADVRASMVATGVVDDIASPLPPTPPSVAAGGLGGRDLPAVAADGVAPVGDPPQVTLAEQSRVPLVPSTRHCAPPTGATVRLLPPPVADAAVGASAVNNRVVTPPRPSGTPPQEEPGSVAERAAIRSAAGRARSLRTRRRNALRVSNMVQAIDYLEVANGRLRIAVTNAVAAAGSSQRAGERARVLAGLRDALGSSAGAGVMLFLRGLLSGLEAQGS